MLDIHRAARLLSRCGEAELSVSQLSAKLGGNHDRMIELIRELQTRGLLTRVREKQSRGRPRHVLCTTPLGQEFIQEYNRLLGLRLLSNDNDINKAIHQADVTQRLEEQRVSVYARFQEVNQLARNIASTAQASRSS